MEIVYAVDIKMSNDGEEFERVFAMDISCLNMLACSCYYLSTSSKLKNSPALVSSSINQTTKSSFCVYTCALEQPWDFHLITTSIVPIVHVVWSLDGTHLLTCNQTGLCRIFKMKSGCVNTMDHVYQYETNEDILIAKYMFHTEPIILNLDRKDFVFYGKEDNQSTKLSYALNSGNFVCVTTSGSIYTLPLNRSSLPYRYFLSQRDPLCASLCDLSTTDKGFNVVLSEYSQGSLIHIFIVHYETFEPKLSYISCQRRGFRIPSCYGTLKSLVSFQRNGSDCVLTQMSSNNGDLVDLYEYNIEQEEWISITLLNSPQTNITSMTLSPSQFVIKDNEFQGHFGRQILITLSDGSILFYDKINLKCKELCFPLNNSDIFSQINSKKVEHFTRIQHTQSGACCVGITPSGIMVLLRTLSLEHVSTSSIVNVFIHLFEQYIVQTPYPTDIWDVLCLIPNLNNENVLMNELVDQLVSRFDEQTIEFKQNNFIRFKQCLFYLHRLSSPYSIDSCEHLISLLIYHILLIVRDYLRLFLYEPANRNIVDSIQDIFQQTSFLQNFDVKRVKYLGDQTLTLDLSTNIDPRQYQSISFTPLINWICDIIFYLIGYLQLQQIPSWLSCKHIFNDPKQIQWLKELFIYFYILNKVNKIPYSKIAHIQPISQTNPTSQDSQQSTQKDVLKDIYHSLSKLQQKLETQKNFNYDESLLEDFSILDIEILQSKIDGFLPKSYPFLITNLSLAQTFIRNHVPPFASHLYGNSVINDTLINNQTSTYNSLMINDDNINDIKFDIITLNKMPLSTNSTFRRCIRCGNFSRIFRTKPYPFLSSRLNNRCVCGGLFLLYFRSTSPLINNSNNVNSINDASTANAGR